MHGGLTGKVGQQDWPDCRAAAEVVRTDEQRGIQRCPGAGGTTVGLSGGSRTTQQRHEHEDAQTGPG